MKPLFIKIIFVHIWFPLMFLKFKNGNSLFSKPIDKKDKH
jgi:hypothetical protein